MKCLRNSLICLGLSLVALASPGTDQARALSKAAERAERKGDRLQAFLLYSRAAALDPSNFDYQIRRNTLESTPGFLEAGPLTPEEQDRLSRLLAEDPSLVEEGRVPLAPPTLKGSAEKKSFNLRGDVRTIFEQVASAFGIQIVFEADYQGPPNMTFRVETIGYQEALHTLELLSNSFIVPVNENMALVVRDTPQKRAELAPAMTIAIPIPERLSIQDAQEIVTAVQQTMEIRRVSVDALRRIVLLRDAVSKVMAAKQLFSQLSKLRAQVEVEVEIITVNKNSSLSYGLSLPNSSAIVNFSHFLRNDPKAALAGFTNFLAFGAGKTLMGFGVADAAAFALVSRNSGQTVLKSDIVALDGQAATFHVGDRFPIVTNQYLGNTSGSDQVYAPPPTIIFEDLGLVLKITPSIHDKGEVSLDVDAEYKLLGAGTVNGIPIISNRKFQGKVRLATGQWGVIAGLVQESKGDTRKGIAGIADIPWIGRLLSRNSIDKTSAEVVIVLKPHLLNLPPWEDPHPVMWVGSDSRPLTVF